MPTFAAFTLSGSSNFPFIGQVSPDRTTIQPITLPGQSSVLNDLTVLILLWDTVKDELELGEALSLQDVELNAPLPYRDVLCVGKNYREHAAIAMPSHPVIFTKRYTSIIGPYDDIYAHPQATHTLDYEGELGVIFGKAGLGIKKDEVDLNGKGGWIWGYTVVNDVTARELQRDHKQFFIGKSLDTFFPQGPFVITADMLPPPHLVEIFTRVNGGFRQRATLDQLIFDIPTLVETISKGITIQPGDLLATGTPAGVGFGLNPPTFLRPGDEVDVAITGIGVLRNKVMTIDKRPAKPHPSILAASVLRGNSNCGLTRMRSGKDLYVEKMGTGPPILFIHGLGGTVNFYSPIANELAKTNTLIRYDAEEDASDVLESQSIKGPVPVVSHSMGTLVAAHLAARHPSLISSLIMLGPVKAIPEPARTATFGRAKTVRAKGMGAVADTIVANATAPYSSPLVTSFAREMLTAQNAEGYARHCEALATGENPDWVMLRGKPILCIAGVADKVSPVAMSDGYAELVGHAANVKVVQIEDCGHWHCLEKPEAVVKAIKQFI
ncbi:hypothetical protein DACRYDRAFT_107649 [Dacryopinax primogenitus]|uniref:Fumarylacetoacetate hydrolase n=1 Tax=Dacryopinax primogenitus (strain DJM 731) TaxID=1858805 RepID=M5FZH2_DACPD|nr:uncharacterized protein DACRYDRAFT_107649 [Dacryopinax primogenitus]EJU01914.1 hypothetical protein DACRYDRAFT_107649 [Dacryopinax primogenitus]